MLDQAKSQLLFVMKIIYGKIIDEVININTPLYTSKEQIVAKSKEAIGHTIGDYNIKPRQLTKNYKGSIGQIIEEGLFGYPINSRAEPDFEKVGVELKVTGLKQTKKDYSMKERLVLNIINYGDEAVADFYSSSFWHKNKNLLIMFYLYEYGKEYGDFLITDSILHNFSEEDLEIIKQDWEKINQKIKRGEAHLISEGDTMYLGACTKASTAEKGWVSQPFSHEKAKQRAYCLKQSYMNQVIKSNNVIENCKHKITLEKIKDAEFKKALTIEPTIKHERVLTIEEIKKSTFETAIDSKLAIYKGRTISEICEMLDYELPKSKQYLYQLTSKMLGLKGSISKSEEFLKGNIEVKTIRILQNNTIKEKMSFPAFKFEELVNEEWETSEIRNLFYSKKFMFVIFKENNEHEYCFEKIVFWNMPLEIIDKDLYSVWEKTKEVLIRGNVVSSVEHKEDGTTIHHNNFPGEKDNYVCHIRPHAINFNDQYPLPHADLLTGYVSYEKQCFWINNNYLLKEVLYK